VADPARPVRAPNQKMLQCITCNISWYATGMFNKEMCWRCFDRRDRLQQGLPLKEDKVKPLSFDELRGAAKSHGWTSAHMVSHIKVQELVEWAEGTRECPWWATPDDGFRPGFCKPPPVEVDTSRPIRAFREELSGETTSAASAEAARLVRQRRTGDRLWDRLRVTEWLRLELQGGRARTGLNTKRFGALLGISSVTVYQIENGVFQSISPVLLRQWRKLAHERRRA
jgi:hypothetical protein